MRQFRQHRELSVEDTLVALAVQEDEIFVRPLDNPSAGKGCHLDAEKVTLAQLVLAHQRLHFVLIAENLQLKIVTEN